MENASSKVVFRLSHEENLRIMAQWLFMGVMNPDEIKHELYSTKVMEYRTEINVVRSEGRTSGCSHGHQSGRASGIGSGGTEGFLGDDTDGTVQSSSLSESEFNSGSESSSESSSESTSESTSYVPTLVPVLGKELAHVQFRSLEEQLFRAMAVLFDQKQRQGVARLVGMSAPVSIYTPTIETLPGSPERTQKYLDTCYAKLPFALPNAKARELLAGRAATLTDDLLKETAEVAMLAKRRLK
jgi:hypothetical protein